MERIELPAETSSRSPPPRVLPALYSRADNRRPICRAMSSALRRNRRARSLRKKRRSLLIPAGKRISVIVPATTAVASSDNGMPIGNLLKK